MPRRAIALLGTLAAACALAGCGLGPGRAPAGVSLTVSRDFGAVEVKPAGGLRFAGEETAMSLLARNFQVRSRYGGGFVEAINGLAGGAEADGQPRDWFYYVNGIEAPKGAAETKLHGGDAIWWDLHDWSQAQETPAVVGSFPQPFLSGSEGKRLPVRIECAPNADAACASVQRRLVQLGVPAGLAAIGPGGEAPYTLRVAVGPFATVGRLPAAAVLYKATSSSGVYARMRERGAALSIFDAHGTEVRKLTAGAGLIAAVRFPGEEPLWLVTGTDAAGVQHAAENFDKQALASHFALAVEGDGRLLPLPAGR